MAAATEQKKKAMNTPQFYVDGKTVKYTHAQKLSKLSKQYTGVQALIKMHPQNLQRSYSLVYLHSTAGQFYSHRKRVKTCMVCVNNNNNSNNPVLIILHTSDTVNFEESLH